MWLSGLPEQAQSAYETALALDPSDPLPFNNLGVLWLDAKNQPAEAIPLFEKAIALNPDYTLAYCNMGRAQCLLGQSNAALLNLQKAKSLNATAPELDPADIVQLMEQAINFGLRPTDPLSSDNIPWDLRATG